MIAGGVERLTDGLSGWSWHPRRARLFIPALLACSLAVLADAFSAIIRFCCCRTGPPIRVNRYYPGPRLFAPESKERFCALFIGFRYSRLVRCSSSWFLLCPHSAYSSSLLFIIRCYSSCIIKRYRFYQLIAVESRLLPNAPKNRDAKLELILAAWDRINSFFKL